MPASVPVFRAVPEAVVSLHHKKDMNSPHQYTEHNCELYRSYAYKLQSLDEYWYIDDLKWIHM